MKRLVLAVQRWLCSRGFHDYYVPIVRRIPAFTITGGVDVVGAFGCTRRGCSAVDVRHRHRVDVAA